MSTIFDLQSFYENILKVPGVSSPETGHFDIFKIEDLNLSNDRRPLFNRRSFFKITLITGKSQLHFDRKVIDVDGTAIVFTNPAIPYFWERLSETQKGYMCIFTSSFFTRFGSVLDFPIFKHNEASVVHLTDRNIEVFTDLFEKIFWENQDTYPYRHDFLRSQLTVIIHEAQKIQMTAGLFEKKRNLSASRIAFDFVELLQRQFPIELKYQMIKLRYPGDFAKEMMIHVNHLNKALKETTGQNTTQLINDRIVSEARILLTQSTWTISEIAYSLGFEEPNNFSAFFKNKTGITPKSFRLQIAD